MKYKQNGNYFANPVMFIFNPIPFHNHPESVGDALLPDCNFRRKNHSSFSRL
jgi:hypothetical protein